MKNDIYGKVSAGSVSVEINCDSSQLDEALHKMNLLIEQCTRAKELGIDTSLLGITVTAAIATGSSRKISRRGLLGLGWRK